VILVVAGDVEPETVGELARQTYGKVAARGAPRTLPAAGAGAPRPSSSDARR